MKRFVKLTLGVVIVIGIQAIWIPSPAAYQAITPIMIALVMLAEWYVARTPRVAIRNGLLSGLLLVSWWMYCSNTIILGAGLYLIAVLLRDRSFWGSGGSVFARTGSGQPEDRPDDALPGAAG